MRFSIVAVKMQCEFPFPVEKYKVYGVVTGGLFENAEAEALSENKIAEVVALGDFF
ncbi:hypothetical protein [Desulfonatronum thioautotrophicum]|uniref:hypothetical protein n=1 Tax=Desulfonatronum thioautotrophicum TaxID=617001 RepID=UPI0012947E77|nr:hypothetical protein [Desulfonatronum thioautotrophicum]